MNNGLVGLVVGACVGGALGYYVRGESGPPGATSEPMAASPVSPSAPREKEADRAGDRSEAAIAASASNASSASNAPDSATSSPDTGPAQKGTPSLAIPGGKLDARRFGDAAPMDKLLNSMSAWCEFDAGAGGQWPHDKVMAHGAAWQGGPLEFETINLVDQTVLMTRNPWTTTPEGTALRATATNAGLHFSGFKPDGELIVVTVFGALDSDARYRAVVSLHGTNLDHESAQFYGWCTVR